MLLLLAEPGGLMNKKIRLILCSVLALALLLWGAPALAIPPLPHAFYGTVRINDADANTSTVVSAKINGENAGSYTTAVSGLYGSLAERDYLAVSNANANDGDTITFYVNGIDTGQTATFQTGGGPTEQPLTLTITPGSITGEVIEVIVANQTDYVVDASAIANTTITVSTLAGLGTVTITVQKYYSNPHPTVALPATMIPRFIDIEVTNPDAVDWPMYVKQTYTDAEVAGIIESSLAMYYFTAGAWNQCSDTGVNTAANYIWANMTRDELTGSPVAIGGIVTPGPGGGGGGARDITAPILSAISVPNITETTADIGWRTNEASTSQVEYWASPTMLSTLDETMVYSHLVRLTGLTPGTTYHYKTMSKDAAGNVAVSDEDTFTTLGEAPAAAFTSGNLSISPREVDIGETVTISVLVTNTGDGSGSYKVTLKINGVVDAAKEVTLKAGASETVIFTTSRDAADSYSVDVDGLTGSFTVRAAPAPPAPPAPPPPPPAPPNWPLIGGIIAGVVVVGLLIFLLVRRRA